jgi:uncharacterized damage-inducible protein DinB
VARFALTPGYFISRLRRDEIDCRSTACWFFDPSAYADGTDLMALLHHSSLVELMRLLAMTCLHNLCNLLIFQKETQMNAKEFLLAELNREAERSRRALEQVPAGKYDWKPHDKSMAFGYLANMVATIPMWIMMQINQDELDIAPKDGGKFEMKRLDTSAEYIEALDKAASGARDAFEKTSDEHLMKKWQLKAGGNVVAEAPRYEMIQDSMLHWAHHRGQMTVYLRLMGAKVPAIYGPSADDKEFR